LSPCPWIVQLPPPDTRALFQTFPILPCSLILYVLPILV
jgi:hypothetical protein